MSNTPKSYSLLDADDSVLIIIDVQDDFLDKLPLQESERLLNNVCWLTAVAAWKQIPLIVAAEEVDAMPVAANLTHALPANTPIFNKVSFGLAYQPNILAAVEGTGRKTAVLIGLETDVCITHSAIGLLEKGYRVAIVVDAVNSPASGHKIGLNRMQNAGVLLVNMKGLFYEWLRTVEAVNQFHKELPHMRALSGIVL